MIEDYIQERRVIRKKGLGSHGMSNRGKVVFDESDIALLPTKLRKARRIIMFRLYIKLIFLAATLFLLYLLFNGDLSILGAILLNLTLVMLLFVDSQINAREERSAKPIRIYEKGIEMPTTWFERKVLKRDFVNWKEVGTIFSLKHNIMENEKLVRDAETELVLIAENGASYSTGIKDREVIKKSIDNISNFWPEFFSERIRIERIVDGKSWFPKAFASIDSLSLILPAALFDGLLVAFLGISIKTDTEVTMSYQLSCPFSSLLT